MPISSEIGTSSPGITLLPVQKIAAHRLQETTDPIAIEEPLEIRLRYGPTAKKQEQSISITMRTPGHDEDLALGWLYTEGILPAGIANIAGISNLAGTTTAGEVGDPGDVGNSGGEDAFGVQPAQGQD